MNIDSISSTENLKFVCAFVPLIRDFNAMQAERNARLLREREERQRRLVEQEQDFSEAKGTSPADIKGSGGKYKMEEGNYGDEAQGLFGWANNNPSSKNAFYDDEFLKRSVPTTGPQHGYRLETT